MQGEIVLGAGHVHPPVEDHEVPERPEQVSFLEDLKGRPPPWKTDQVSSDQRDRPSARAGSRRATKDQDGGG
jgi:hypothetical protein